MKILIDNNLSPRIAKVMQETYDGIIHVADVELDFADDLKIWEYAKDNDYSIFTKDKDFKYLQEVHGAPPKIIWIRSGNKSTNYVIQVLTRESEVIKQFLTDPTLDILEIH